VSISGTVATVGGLSIATGGAVNVNSALLLTSDSGSSSATQTTIQQYIASGAITSTFAATNGLGIAYGDGSDTSVLNPNLQPGQVVIEPDLMGDADLNGAVNFHDLQVLLGNFGSAGFWDQGNFNGDATVDFNDLQLLLNNFGDSITLSYARLSAIENVVGQFGAVAEPNADGVGFTLTSVPEPASMLCIAPAFAILMRRRVKRV